MSTADFRHIAFKGSARNCERLFRAAISGFCSLARPTRNELAQLDDLALGLYDTVPAEARRFAAAALCESDPAPTGLVRRLCDEPVEISAPLLVRSRALTDVDLISFIARHGLPHARAIARRDGLNPVVASLIRALIARAESAAETGEASASTQDPLREIRTRLRGLMQDAGRDDIQHSGKERLISRKGEAAHRALRDAALTGEASVFGSALAEALSISPVQARRLAAGITYSDLLVGLKALELAPEQAFLVTAAAYPAQLSHTAAIRLFLERYQAITTEQALEKVIVWRLQDRRKSALPQRLESVR